MPQYIEVMTDGIFSERIYLFSIIVQMQTKE